MTLMITYVAGVGYREGARERLAELIPGERLRLEREPTNQYDKNAVAVYDGDLHLGYVPAADAPAVSKALASPSMMVEAAYSGVGSTTEIKIDWRQI